MILHMSKHVSVWEDLQNHSGIARLARGERNAIVFAILLGPGSYFPGENSGGSNMKDNSQKVYSSIVS